VSEKTPNPTSLKRGRFATLARPFPLLIGAAVIVLCAWGVHALLVAGTSSRGGLRCTAARSGGLIAFDRVDRGSSSHIYVMNADGCGVRQLSFGNVSDFSPTWSPDGRRIVFNCAYSACMMNADGSDRRKLRTAHDFEDPAWSPNGQQIAFYSNDDKEIYVMNLDGSGVMRLTHGVYADDPSWSPDGRKIAFTGSDPSGYGIDVITATGGGLQSLHAPTGGGAGIDLFGGVGSSWSPDGRQIAYECKTARSQADGEICVMSANGRNKRQLTLPQTQDSYPSWSPDGRMIVFTRFMPPLDYEIYIVNADGSQLRQLTRGADDEDPAWQPRVRRA